MYQPAGYSTEQVMPGYPVHIPGTTYMSDPYQTPLPVSQSEPIIQPDTSTTDSCNSNLLSQQLFSDLQDTLKTECEQDTPSLPPSLMDRSSLQATETPVPLTVSISVLNLRFMTLGNHLKTRVAELEQVYREQAAGLESQRYHALCTPRGLSTVSVSVYYDQQHQDLINRIQHSLQLLPTCLIPIRPLYQSASQPDTSIKYYKFKMAVVIEGKVSSYLLITSGIPQCSIIGTFLFVLYINDVCDVCTSFKKLYADRAIIYQKLKSIQYVLSLQKDLLLLWSQI